MACFSLCCEKEGVANDIITSGSHANGRSETHIASAKLPFSCQSSSVDANIFKKSRPGHGDANDNIIFG
jgi:hypothetical protein